MPTILDVDSSSVSVFMSSVSTSLIMSFSSFLIGSLVTFSFSTRSTGNEHRAIQSDVRSNHLATLRQGSTMFCMDIFWVDYSYTRIISGKQLLHQAFFMGFEHIKFFCLSRNCFIYRGQAAGNFDLLFQFFWHKQFQFFKFLLT